MAEKIKNARVNEVAYCGAYCRTCYWYNDKLRKTAQQLLELIKGHFEVAGWIDYKGVDSKVTINGLEILSKSACTYDCKGGSGWSGCPVRNCCIAKGLDFCFQCSDFPCANWDERGEHSNVFTASKKRRLLEMKEIGVEEWIKKQWK